MMKKVFHIGFICVLALNLMGAWALASALDCGMACCKPGDWAGTTSFEAPSCCQMNDITCGFETGTFEEIFDTAVCCFSTPDNNQHSAALDIVKVDTDIPTYRNTVTRLSTGPPPDTPVYLSNASFLC